MKESYGIKNWQDTKTLNAKLKNLLESPIRQLKDEAIETYSRYYNVECKKSKAMIEEAKHRIVGGVQHNLALNYPFPIAMNKVDGAYMWDVDGHKYIDLLQAGGPTVLGSNYGPVKEKAMEVIADCGPVVGLFHEYEYKLADLIHQHMPSIESFRMLGSGTEGAMAAIRIARGYTGNKYVIKNCGAYHGWSDQLAYDIRFPGTKGSYGPGIPDECQMYTQAVPINDLEVMRNQLKINREKGGTACIIVEPFGPESGTRQIEEGYNQELRALCNEFGALLIFDEVVTGFRTGLGGAQGYYGIKPDLTVFGKAITGGYPAAGGVGGSKEVMSCLTPGLGNKVNKVLVGGTLSANPLSCVAGYYAIKEIEKTDACVKAGAAGDRLTIGMQEIFDRYELPFVAYNQGSIVHFDATGHLYLSYGKDNYDEMLEINHSRQTQLNQLGMALMAEGLVTIAAHRAYTSLADTENVIDEALNRVESICRSYK